MPLLLLLTVLPFLGLAASDPPKEIDPCALVVEKDAVEILGGEVTVGAQKNGALPTCLYKNVKTGRVALTLYGSAESYEKRLDFAQFTWKVKPEPVPDLGDRAHLVGNQIFVEKKPTIFAITVVRYQHPSTEELNKQLTGLAKLAVSRLP